MDLTTLSEEELKLYSNEIARRNKVKSDQWYREQVERERLWRARINAKLAADVRVFFPEATDELIEQLKDCYDDYYNEIYDR